VTTLQLKDGASLAFREAGDGQALLFLHGWSMCKEVFDRQFAHLSDRFHTVAPDLRGHGASSNADADDTIATLANDVAELIEALEITDVVLVGWSMGAMVSWQLMRGPAAERIAGIVAIDMIPRVLRDSSWPYGMGRGEGADAVDTVVERMLEDWSGFADELVPRNVAGGSEAERSKLLQQLAVLVKKNDPESMATLWRSLCDQDFRQDVGNMSIPTIIAHGERGQLYGEAAFAWMEQNIPNSRRVSFSDSGHAPHMEESTRFNEVLEQFADGLRGEPASASANKRDTN